MAGVIESVGMRYDPKTNTRSNRKAMMIIDMPLNTLRAIFTILQSCDRLVFLIIGYIFSFSIFLTSLRISSMAVECTLASFFKTIDAAHCILSGG